MKHQLSVLVGCLLVSCTCQKADPVKFNDVVGVWVRESLTSDGQIIALPIGSPHPQIDQNFYLNSDRTFKKGLSHGTYEAVNDELRLYTLNALVDVYRILDSGKDTLALERNTNWVVDVTLYGLDSTKVVTETEIYLRK